jgi:methylase of polypeptide subunit release factors
MEIGCRQAESVAALLEAAEAYRDIAVVKDLYGLDRIVKAYKE